MGINLSPFLNILAKPPGDLIYHLVVSLAFLLTGYIALVNLDKTSKNNPAQRTLIGCAILLLTHLSLFGLRSFNLQTDFSSTHFYPIFERLVSVLTITWLVWVFLNDDRSFFLTGINILLSLALIILAGFSLFVIPRVIHLSRFDLFAVDIVWQSIALMSIMIGLVLAIIQRPSQRFIMILILFLLAGGHITQMIFQTELQWHMGAVRIAQTLSLPWIMALVQRFSRDSNQSRFNHSGADEDFVEIPVDTKPLLVNWLLKINLTEASEEKYQAIVRALSLSVIADVCYLVDMSEEADKLHISAGYDLIREVDLAPDSLVREDLPRVMKAWQSGRSLQLSQSDADTRDVITLATLLRYHSIGNLFAYPLDLPENPLVGGVLFLSPYTGKSWGTKTMQLMDQIKDTLAQVLFSPDPLEQMRAVLEQTQAQMSVLIAESDDLRLSLTQKNAQIQEKEIAIKELKARYQIEKMETVTSIEHMQGRISELTSQVALQEDIARQLEQLKTEIRQLTSEREQLSLALSRTNALVKDLQTQTGQTGPIRLSLESQIISLDSIAANVRLLAAPPMGQKDVDLEINNPDGRQMVKTDPELLQTALLELIMNAIMASDFGGTIRLDLTLSLEMGMLIIQVTDFGKGLTQTEQTALFSGQRQTIPGIGDVQSIRNAIRAIRVLNGKIWLRSKKSSYTTFRLQIPVRIID